MAAADCRGQRRRFTVACGVLSRHVRADAEAAAALAGPSAMVAPSRTMLLIPGADVTRDASDEPEPEPHAQLTIMYGERVVVVDDVPEDRVAELVRVASAMPQQDALVGGLADMRVARKESLRRFMEKRRGDRIAAQASKKTKTAEEAHAGPWLGLGIPGECRR